MEKRNQSVVNGSRAMIHKEKTRRPAKGDILIIREKKIYRYTYIEEKTEEPQGLEGSGTLLII